MQTKYKCNYLNNTNNILSDYSIWINEWNISNVTKEERKELGLLTHKLCALQMNRNSVI